MQRPCMPGACPKPQPSRWHGSAAAWLLLLLAVAAVAAQPQPPQQQEEGTASLSKPAQAAPQHVDIGEPRHPGVQQEGLTALLMPWLAADVPSNHSYAHLRAILAPPVLQRYAVIELAADYKVLPALYNADAEPLHLTRNLTITSANFTTQGYRLLELEFLSNRLLIGKGVTLTLQSLALGRARKTSGQSIPFFAGEGVTSTLLFIDVIRVRTACAHNTAELLAGLERIERPAAAAARDNGTAPPQQVVSLLPAFAFRGRVYEGSVHAEDLHAFVSPADVADAPWFDAGYQLVQLNATRVCETYVSDDCVAKRGGDVCVLQQVDEVLQAEQQQPPRPLNLPAIVAPAVVGGVVLLAAGAAAALLLKRRRRRRAAAQQALLPVSRKGLPRSDSPQGPGAAGAGGSHGGPQDSEEEDEGGLLANPNALPGARSGAAGSIATLAVGSRGGRWSLVSWHRAAEFEDATPDDKLKLGVLLGAGSFGRVYRGVWRHLDVAVKVLQHDASTAAAISNEVDLVMSFRHPNVVSAYYFLTWSRGDDEPEQAPAPAVPPAPPAAEAGGVAPGPRVIPHSSSNGGHRLPSSQQQQQQHQLPGLAPVAQAGGAGGGGLRAFSIIDSSAAAGGMDGKHAARATLGGGSNSSCSSRHHSRCVHELSPCVTSGYTCHSSNCSMSSSSSAMWHASTTGRSLASSSGVAARTPSVATVVIAGEGSCSSSACHAPLQQRSWSSKVQHEQQQLEGRPPAEPHPAAHCVPQQLAALRQAGAGADAAAGGLDAATPHDQAAAAAAADVGGSGGVMPAGGRGHHRVSFKGGPLSVSSSAADTSAASLIPVGVCQQQQLPSSSDMALQAVSQPLPAIATPAILGRPVLRASAAAFGSADSSCGSGARDGRRRQAGSKNEAQTWLILELCDGGTLLDLIEEGSIGAAGHSGMRRLAHILTLLLDVSRGMAYLHARNVLHGDLKPGNVLIKRVQGAPYGRVAKVADFGLSRALLAGQSHRSTRTLATLNHAPPELLRLGRLSPAADVYSYGVLMWECYTGRTAFSGWHHGEVFEAVAFQQRRPEVPAGMPPAYAALMEQCWTADPFARPPFTSVEAQLQAMLAGLLQDEAEAHKRFVADL